MIPDLIDTIAAIGTAAGGAARGMIRVSGPQTVDCISQCFYPTTNLALSSIKHSQTISGELRLDGGPALPCELLLWPNERSYTRQPSAELHTLGSPPLLELALSTLCRHGARMAEPGEFTLRAFLAGRLDLTQAEAVLGVIDAQNSESLQTALGQLAGGLSKPLMALREQLLQLLAHLEAGLDFVEEDIEFIAAAEIERQLASAQQLVAETLAQLISRNQSQVLPKVVLVGPPNAGKSSLFNALVDKYRVSDEHDRALVSELAGTTRDYLMAAVDLQGLKCALIDTAGVDPLVDEGSIPGFAQEMTGEQRKQADCQVQCFDATAPLENLPESDSTILVQTKSDLLPEQIDAPQQATMIRCSSRTGEGLELLAQTIATQLGASNSSGAVASTTARCTDSLHRAAESLESALALVHAGGGDELLAADLRSALAELGRVVGAVYTDDVLDRIFSQFCIGK
jgi:tRNA modification GTPase